ncbi:MAG: sigma-70 family RNA polymerase sigma factor [Limisphaerales bacterium]
MSELDDHQLLAEFTRTHSEAAFAALAERHVNLVYSVALRSVGNAHAAEEISQAVFIILARKARTLSPKIVLSGWLYQTTRLAAANFLRGEIRRQQREQEAYMQSTLNESEPQVWSQIAPLLDDALGRLGEADRNAIVLRFFENKNLREVGATLGASEDTAKMRVNRALEKLRKMFRKRGVNLTATIIAVAVSANSVQAAPVGLAMTVTAAVAKGAVVSGSTLTLIKGALKLMAWTKAKIAIAVGVGMLLAVGTTTIAVKQFQAHHRYSWQMPKATRDLIRNTPPQVVIVPSKFSQDGGTYRDYMKGGRNYGHLPVSHQYCSNCF